MKSRWERLSDIISLSKRFSPQQIAPQYYNFFHKVRAACPEQGGSPKSQGARLASHRKNMAKIQSSKYVLCLVSSLVLNLISIINIYVGSEWNLNWSSRAAREAEAVAAISCSGHGRAYLDGIIVDGKPPICECNSCYTGPDCSQPLPDCAANAEGGDPLFLEPFWMQNAASSAILVAGWHRMSYTYTDDSYISQELDRHIRKLHAIVGNAVTEKRFMIFGAGSTQLLNAAVHALSPDNSSLPAKVVATTPFYPRFAFI
ncbi:hypothetical protein Patl1_07984 [Pistacia atlantica]|uniref:Uncharacterized protein n=1 Tax=Pistacia atlantica TaxID=434234 RepID=A0ACC1AK84_9ROSI|nr:hypothetical protein Patl1_07984 [Pistacia atlantica]